VKPDLVLGLAASVLAAAYYAAAEALPRSLLADAVGADGAPKAYAIALGLLGIVQMARAVARADRARDRGGKETAALRTHLRALGVIAIGAVYMVAMPYLGYLLATAVLIYVLAVYAGQAHSWRTAVISLGGGAVLWISFAKLLGVAMPAGFLGGLVG
jgi:hypothetical protein